MVFFRRGLSKMYLDGGIERRKGPYDGERCGMA